MAAKAAASVPEHPLDHLSSTLFPQAPRLRPYFMSVAIDCERAVCLLAGSTRDGADVFIRPERHKKISGSTERDPVPGVD